MWTAECDPCHMLCVVHSSQSMHILQYTPPFAMSIVTPVCLCGDQIGKHGWGRNVLVWFDVQNVALENAQCKAAH